MNPAPVQPSYDLELTFVGLTVFTFSGADKRRPDAVQALMVRTDDHGMHHHAPSPEESGAADRGRRHFPLFTFSPENLTEDSPIDAYNLVPGPDGRQIGQMSLQGDFTIEMAPDETQGPRDLTAVWRPPANGPLPQRPATAAEEEWLNWVPGLQSVNPSIPLPNDALPLAGLNGNQAAASLIFNRGVLTAGRLARAQNGSIAVYEFKLPGNAPVLGSQAIAGALILRLEGLTRPVFIHGHPSGPLGLINLADRVVRASFTNLPDVEVGEQTRLVHFRHLFNFTNLPVITANQIPLPEGRGIPDTSFGTICPGATFTRVP